MMDVVMGLDVKFIQSRPCNNRLKPKLNRV